LVAYPQIKQVAERLELLECAVKLYEALWKVRTGLPRLTARNDGKL
jgi:hypothetical protein